VKHAGFACVFVLLCLCAFNADGLAQLPSAAPASVGMSASQLAHVDEAVQAEIAKHQLPGAVVLVGRQGKIVWRKAYGNRALEPQAEPMTADTIFDMASLTKVVATATSMMVLVERVQVRFGDTFFILIRVLACS
jgi:CubicO group peptidase (beta-lactamase class C family)